MTSSVLFQIYQKLRQAFGPQNWWQTECPFEVCIAVILAQNTSWPNLRLALDNLKAHNVLSFDGLRRATGPDLESWIHSVGSFRAKARTLKNFIAAIEEQHGDFAALSNLSDRNLQEFLMGIKGIGPETCDSMRLYAFARPVFVVDRSTHRILVRHRLLPAEADFFELKEYCERHFGDDVADLQQCHALIVKLGKEFCKKTKPLCESCPLQDVNGGPCLESEF